MPFRCAVVIRGNKMPLPVDLISRIALGSGDDVPIPTFCANNLEGKLCVMKNSQSDNKRYLFFIKIVLMKQLFYSRGPTVVYFVVSASRRLSSTLQFVAVVPAFLLRAE